MTRSITRVFHVFHMARTHTIIMPSFPALAWPAVAPAIPRRKPAPLVVALVGLFIASAIGPLAAQGDRPGPATIIVEELPENRHFDIVRRLDDTGYRIISINRTFLNRIRIQAANDVHLREIVFSPSTGGILRDVVLERYGAGGPPG